jgi:hypothetical protein
VKTDPVQHPCSKARQRGEVVVDRVAVTNRVTPKPGLDLPQERDGCGGARGLGGMRSPIGQLKAVQSPAYRKLRDVDDPYPHPGSAQVVPERRPSDRIIRHTAQPHAARVILHVEELLEFSPG